MKKAGEKRGSKKPGTFQPGHDPRRNLTTPGAGRPRGSYMDNLKGLLYSTGVQDRLLAILKHSDPDLFLKTWDKIHDKIEPRPPQTLQHTGSSDAPVVIESPRERILSRLARLAATGQTSTAA